MYNRNLKDKLKSVAAYGIAAAYSLGINGCATQRAIGHADSTNILKTSSLFLECRDAGYLSEKGVERAQNIIDTGDNKQIVDLYNNLSNIKTLSEKGNTTTEKSARIPVKRNYEDPNLETKTSDADTTKYRISNLEYSAKADSLRQAIDYCIKNDLVDKEYADEISQKLDNSEYNLKELSTVLNITNARIRYDEKHKAHFAEAKKDSLLEKAVSDTLTAIEKEAKPKFALGDSVYAVDLKEAREKEIPSQIREGYGIYSTMGEQKIKKKPVGVKEIHWYNTGIFANNWVRGIAGTVGVAGISYLVSELNQPKTKTIKEQIKDDYNLPEDPTTGGVGGGRTQEGSEIGGVRGGRDDDNSETGGTRR